MKTDLKTADLRIFIFSSLQWCLTIESGFYILLFYWGLDNHVGFSLSVNTKEFKPKLWLVSFNINENNSFHVQNLVQEKEATDE